MDLEQFISDHKLAIRNNDHDVQSLLAAIERRRDPWTNPQPVKLLAFRKQFRKTLRRRPIVGLILALSSRSAETQCIALWLLGRCRARIATPVVDYCAGADWPLRTREEAARTLRRLDAWKELRAIAEFEPEETRLRVLATQRPARPWASRLPRFLRHCDSLPPTATSAPKMAVFPDSVGQVWAPKSHDFIRRLLEHIRSLMRSQA